jgi:hypothetical protein
MAIRTRNRNRTCNRNRNRTRTRNRTCNRNRTFTRGRNFLEGHHPPHASIQGDTQITANSEFDLFNCELLESDHEDQAEQFPPESPGDTF